MQTYYIGRVAFNARLRSYDDAHHVRAELMSGEDEGWEWEVIESDFDGLFALRVFDEAGHVAGYLEF